MMTFGKSNTMLTCLGILVSLLFVSSTQGVSIVSDAVEPNDGWSVTGNGLGFFTGCCGVAPTAGGNLIHINNIGGRNANKTFSPTLFEGTYTVTFDIGNFNNAGFSIIDLANTGLTAGGVVQTPTVSVTPSPALGATNQWSLTYDITAGNPNIGSPLGFQLISPDSGDNLNASFDNLEIDLAVAPPPPSTIINATPYQSFETAGNLSPFSGAAGGPFGPLTTVAGDRTLIGTAGEYFHLEDAEDGAVDTPGLTITPNAGAISVLTGGPGIDSVDEDDGVIDNQRTGTARSIFRDNNGNALSIDFDANVLGELPTHAGFAITDGGTAAINTIDVGERTVIEAFDQFGQSLGVIDILNSAFLDNSFGSVSTAEDRFFGFINEGGIASISVTSLRLDGTIPALASFEIDHVQYGRLATIPEPATAILIGSLLAIGARRRTRAT